MQGAYEMVVGLEVHVELKTLTKIFCGCETAFGAEPNTRCCPVCLGLPGALPVLNKKAVLLAARAGLATNCRIALESRLDRKHYFYPDLPKAYQVSQYDRPLCEKGYLLIDTETGEKRIGITRIHIEEDAGKLSHGEDGETRVDLNRCGAPLIELVTEPDFRSAQEARVFLQKLRAILVRAGVSDCRMNEGQMRCDVNLSVRKKGETALGTRTEMKNLNSFAFAAKAIEYEFSRQVKAVSAGEKIVQETRRFDPASGKTIAMRGKENADDYRYFPDPDLPPVRLFEAELSAIRAELPELPDAQKARYQRDFGLSAREAGALCASEPLSDAFERAAPLCREPKALANLLVEAVARFTEGDEPTPFAPGDLAALSDLIAGGTLHFGAAGRVLEMMRETGKAPLAIVREEGLAQVSDEAFLARAVDKVILENGALVQTYLGGKEKAFQALMGRVMAETKGRANPGLAAALLGQRLSAPR